MQSCPTKARLMRAMIELTAKNGLENVGIRDLASSLNLSVAAMYRHFESRDDLASQTFLQLDKKLTDFALEASVFTDPDAEFTEEDLREIWSDMFHYLLDNKEETLFVLRYRYSGLYTPEVRAQRVVYSGACDQAIKKMLTVYGKETELYPGFLINEFFELTLSFAEKVHAGKLTYSTELEDRLWTMICAMARTLSTK